MAIARDSHSKGGNTGASSLSFGHTISSNTNGLLLVGFLENKSTTTDLCTGVTYNGVSMTKLKGNAATGGFGYYSIYGLLTPDTGNHNIVISFSATPEYGIRACSSAYTGVAQTGLPDATGFVGANTGTSRTLSITTVADNSWVFGYAEHDAATITASTGFNELDAQDNYFKSGDSNGAITPAGSYSMSVTFSSSGYYCMMQGVSFAPYTTPTSAIKTINGLAKASVKTVNGLAIASVKTFNGLA